MTKRDFPKRAIHLDFHTMPVVYDVGRDFDAADFAKTLSEAHGDYITVFAKCNLGFTYYPTNVGVPHPGLQTPDMLGGMVSACHQRDIQVAAYINVGLDHEQALRHRDWCKLNKSGQVYEMQTMSHFFRKMCLNTGYRDYTLAMIAEVLDNYPIDGLFLDCFTLSPCYGVECVAGMREMGLDGHDDEQASEFCWRVTERFVQEVKALVDAKAPGINLYYNGLPYRWQPTHVEIEVLPTASWGYEYLPWAARYARTLDKPFFTMTGRFHKGWGDFGGLRPEHSLLFDCYNSAANGGTCSIGDHMHPRGTLEPAAYDLIGSVYSRIRVAEEWTVDAEAVSEIAILLPALRRVPGDRAHIDMAGLKGATRMLMELKYQFDVCDGDVDLSTYRVIILPDRVDLTEPLRRKLSEYLARGGAVISAASGGLDPDGVHFALAEAGAISDGPEPHVPAFFRARGAAARGIPDMLTTIYDQGIALRTSAGAEVLAELHKPYFNQGSWDWQHENVYIPPEADTGRPALIRVGDVFHFSFPVFGGYFRHAVQAYRTLLGNCIASVLPEPLVKVGGLLSFGQVTLTQKGRERIVHLLTYVPEQRGAEMQVVEDPISASDVEIAVRNDGAAVSHVFLAPQRTKLSFMREGGYTIVSVPRVTGYQMVVFEP